MSTFNYIISTNNRDQVLISAIRHGKCGNVLEVNSNQVTTDFTVRSDQQWKDLQAILGGEADYNSTIVRLGSQSGKPLFRPVTVKQLNHF